ncbi:MAG: nucleotide exchange factor GrpE [Pseudonocardiaceae bacterium]|nr:nucleotide exchange factor GrpE [Pseudonocardiaceae bacterium]
MSRPVPADPGPEDERPGVVIRDKRRIDPVTGEVRVPGAGAASAPGTATDVEAVIGDVPAGASADGNTADTEADELTKLQAELAERTSDLQRISAEYTNYRRRVERDRQAVIAGAKAQVAGELLAVLDDIERAAEHGDLNGAFKAVADKLAGALESQGLTSFGAPGDGFDPDVHEAVQHATSPGVSGPTVTTVLRRGYRFDERVLRPAMVAVTDHGTGDEPDPESSN